MSYLIEEITLESTFGPYSLQRTDDSVKRLENLGKINVFVGSNNSGKSRLLRAIAGNVNNVFEPRADIRPDSICVRDLTHVAASLIQDFNEVLTLSHAHDILGIRGRLEKYDKQPDIQGLVQGKVVLNELRGIFSAAKNASTPESYSTRWKDGYQIRPNQALPRLKEWGEKQESRFARLFECDSTELKFRHLYVPTLRSLRELDGTDLLKTRTANDYKLSNIIVFSGQTLFDEVESLLRGTLNDRETLRRFEVWIGNSFFEGASFALIPRKGHKTLTVKIGDEEEKQIHELGDGIQSILILTFELFKHADEYVLGFFEEPELFLHPWLQRVLLTTLSKEFPKHQYFLTTHSNHFLDLTLDIADVSVFTFDKELEDKPGKEKSAIFTIRQASIEDRKPLELLGVRNSSVLLSNCTIWVEGITDRRYLAHWLTLYDKVRQKNAEQQQQAYRSFKEDLHYSFVEYGGGNITHFSFLEQDVESEDQINVERLCSKLFLITDQDGAEPESAKGRRHSVLQDRLGDRYCCLSGREIENLIHPNVVKAVLHSYGEENLPEFEHSAYLQAKLGDFIEDLLTKSGSQKKRKGPYAKESGTITDKIGFCRRAIEASESWDDLSDHAQTLIKRVYDFISSCNE